MKRTNSSVSRKSQVRTRRCELQRLLVFACLCTATDVCTAQEAVTGTTLKPNSTGSPKSVSWSGEKAPFGVPAGGGDINTNMPQAAPVGYIASGANCNCGARVQEWSTGKPTSQTCADACTAYAGCASYGVWRTGHCALFDMACPVATDGWVSGTTCPNPTKNPDHPNLVYNKHPKVAKSFEQAAKEATQAAEANVKNYAKQHQKEIMVGLIAGGSAAAAAAVVGTAVGISNAIQNNNKVCKPGKFAFKNHTYVVLDEHDSWDAQQARCKSSGGHLVSISTAAENDFLISVMSGADSAWDRMWIGMDHGSFSSWSNGGAMRYVRWQVDQPRCSSCDHACGGLDRRYEGKWTVIDCSAQLRAICEIDQACQMNAAEVTTTSSTAPLAKAAASQAISFTSLRTSTTPLPMVLRVLAREGEEIFGRLGKGKLIALLIGLCVCFLSALCAFCWCICYMTRRKNGVHHRTISLFSRPDEGEDEESMPFSRGSTLSSLVSVGSMRSPRQAMGWRAPPLMQKIATLVPEPSSVAIGTGPVVKYTEVSPSFQAVRPLSTREANEGSVSIAGTNRLVSQATTPAVSVIMPAGHPVVAPLMHTQNQKTFSNVPLASPALSCR